MSRPGRDGDVPPVQMWVSQWFMDWGLLIGCWRISGGGYMVKVSRHVVAAGMSRICNYIITHFAQCYIYTTGITQNATHWTEKISKSWYLFTFKQKWLRVHLDLISIEKQSKPM